MRSSAEPPFTPVACISTDHVASREKFDAWQAIIGSAYTIGAQRAGFHGAVRIAAVDRMMVQTMDAAPQSVARSPEQIRRDGLERISLHLSVNGFDFSSPRREGRLHPGQIIVSDLGRPHARSLASDRGSAIISLSRDLVESALQGTDDLHGLVLSGPTAGLLGEHMRMLASRMDQLPRISARALSEATAALLAAALGSRRDVHAQAQASLDAARLLRAKRYIRAHLDRPGMSPDVIARAIGVSRSKLFTVFEPEGGVERYVLKRRLAAVADALRNPREVRTIAELSRAYGFVSAPHFARVFRTRFGLTAGEMRADRDRNAMLPAQADHSAFEQWLRQLG